MRQERRTGFTIVELLIVIVIIGILAGLVVNIFVGVQEKARKTRALSEVKSMGRFIRTLQTDMGVETISEVTGSNYSSLSCYDIGNIQRIPKTHACWVAYNNFLDAFEAHSKNSMAAWRNGDPWGAPYVIDENEGECRNGNGLRQDVFKSAGPDGIYNDGDDDISWRLDRFKATPDC